MRHRHMSWAKGFYAVLIAAFLCLPAFGVEPDEVLSDPVLEARARAISKELRCLVCQNENIDSSNAPLARDLRIILRERLVAGDTDEEAVAFVVDRYGDFVLLRPPVKSYTLVLWFGPLMLLLAGVLTVMALFRSQRRAASGEVMSDEEQAALKRLLEKDPT